MPKRSFTGTSRQAKCRLRRRLVEIGENDTSQSDSSSSNDDAVCNVRQLHPVPAVPLVAPAAVTQGDHGEVQPEETDGSDIPEAAEAYGGGVAANLDDVFTPSSDTNSSSEPNSESDREMLDGADSGDEDLDREMLDGADSGDEDIGATDSDRDVDSDEMEMHRDNDDFNRHEAPVINDPPLFNGSTLTVSDSMLAILSFFLSHNLTSSCLSDLLKLIALHCPPVNNCIKTLYHFKKYFRDLQSPISRHFFCSGCYANLDSNSDQCNHCPAGTKIEFFITISVVDQIQSMFKRNGFLQSLEHRTLRVKKNINSFEDIYDGSLYKEACESGFFSSPSNVSLMWNTDGASLFKSSKFSIWPMYLVLNELPFNKRFKKENVIIAGLWFGNKKPVPNLFLSKMYLDIHRLQEGVNVQVPGQEPITVKAKVLCGTCDLPAKSLFLNMKQYSGYSSCPKCLVHGEKSIRTGNVLVFPFEGEVPLRTDEGCTQDAAAAHHSGTPVNGIFGPTYMSLLCPKLFSSTAVDVMHCIYQGVAKRLMHLWFDSEFREFRFSLAQASGVVSDRLVQITPPCFVARMPRSISEHLSFWKASEFKTWLFYYSLPVLCDIMPPEFFNHHMQLVYSIYLLNQSSISEDMINTASQHLKEYVSKFQQENMYGIRFMSMNVHSLLHLPECVRSAGPLFIASCMPFEDLNGQILKLVHSSKHPALQICSSLGQFVNLPILLEKLPENNSVRVFCETLLNNNKRLSVQETVSPGVHVIGKCVKPDVISPDIEGALFDYGVVTGNVALFNRLLKGNRLYYTETYGRSLKTSSVCVRYLSQNEICFGSIKYFAAVRECHCAKVCQCPANYYALLFKQVCHYPFHIMYPEVTVTFIHEFVRDDVDARLVAIPVQELDTVCFLVVVGERTFIAEPTNTMEYE